MKSKQASDGISYNGVPTITPGATELNIHGFIADTAGNITFTDRIGNTVTALPILASVEYHIACATITAFTGTTLYGLS